MTVPTYVAVHTTAPRRMPRVTFNQLLIPGPGTSSCPHHRQLPGDSAACVPAGADAARHAHPVMVRSRVPLRGHEVAGGRTEVAEVDRGDTGNRHPGSLVGHPRKASAGRGPQAALLLGPRTPGSPEGPTLR